MFIDKDEYKITFTFIKNVVWDITTPYNLVSIYLWNTFTCIDLDAVSHLFSMLPSGRNKELLNKINKYNK